MLFIAMKSLAVSCLLATLALPCNSICAAERQPSIPSKVSASLEAELELGEVDQPRVLAGVLRELGLRLMGDVLLLNAPERLELSESLRAAGVDLGSRSKLRRLSDSDPQSGQQLHLDGSVPLPSTKAKPPQQTAQAKSADGGGAPLGVAEANRRQLQERTGFSLEVAAIVVTGLLGMIGYIVQARSAQKASEAQAALEREAAVREKAEAKAGKQLERVQLQMSDWVMPVLMETQAVGFGWFCMAKVRQPREHAV